MSNEMREQPQSIEAEEGLLASCLIDPPTIDQCIELGITPDYFFKTSHSTIFEGILAIHEEGRSAECEIALLEWLRRKGKEQEVGGISAIYTIQGRVETPAHSRYFIRVVHEKATLRKIIRESRIAIEDAYEQTTESLEIAARLAKLADAAGQSNEAECKPVAVTINEAMDQINRELQGVEEDGLCFGLSDLDDALGKLRPATQTVLAARPGTGKTSLIQLATEWCEQNDKKVLIFSLEMTGAQFDYRYLCMKARVDSRHIRDGVANAGAKERLIAAAKETKVANNRWIVDGYVDVHQIRAIARRMHHKHGIDLIIIDYLQIVRRPKGVKSEEAVSEISAGTKHMSKEMNLPVLILAQIMEKL